MTRTISKTMSGILEDLELNGETYISLPELQRIAEKNKVKTAPSLIAQRLKENGWLLPTDQRGIWEFSPASRAGAYSKNDPLREIIAYQMKNPGIECFLCLQTAAWALGLADRIPSQKELAFPQMPRNQMSSSISAFFYKPVLKPREARGVLCLMPESIVVHLATKPQSVTSWDSAMEWFPDVVYETDSDKLMEELSDKPDSVKRRTGYLLQGMYPEAARKIYSLITGHSKIRFGPRVSAIRNDEYWMVSDTILPFSPKEVEKVK